MQVAEDVSRVRKDLCEYDRKADKRTKDREKFTRLEKVLEEEWKDVVASDKNSGRIAYAVCLDSEKGITFYDAPKECPLTLEQVLKLECFPRKCQYGPDLDCVGKWAPDVKQKKIMEKYAKLNETLDDHWVHDPMPGPDQCPDGFYEY
mgnify:CR=1 FL=1